eukprot:352745-Chlamydomonas_euryale.AAC.4
MSRATTRTHDAAHVMGQAGRAEGCAAAPMARHMLVARDRRRRRFRRGGNGQGLASGRVGVVFGGDMVPHCIPAMSAHVRLWRSCP